MIDISVCHDEDGGRCCHPHFVLEEFPGILVAPDSVVVGNPSVIQRRVYG